MGRRADISSMEKLRQLIYVSSAVRLLREPELLEILDVARANNSQLDVTGMLLYAGGSFIQVLEGDAQMVERVVRKIKRDARHRGFLTLLDRVLEERDFEGWNMGFHRVSEQDRKSVV